MKRLFFAAALSLGVAACGEVKRAEGPAPAAPDPKAANDPLPGGDRIAWDVKSLEAAEDATLLKREVQGRQVTWQLEYKGAWSPGVCVALFLDEDKVKFKEVACKLEAGDGPKDGRVVLKLPDGYDKQTRFIILKRSAVQTASGQDAQKMEDLQNQLQKLQQQQAMERDYELQAARLKTIHEVQMQIIHNLAPSGHYEYNPATGQYDRYVPGP